MGKGLRFVQEYFLVACSLQRSRAALPPRQQRLATLPDKVAIQLNDTHPAMAVAELMRILLDEASLGWDEAWDHHRSGRSPTPITRCCPKRSRSGRWPGSR